ncbi:hypothetical protein STRDD10_00650 [Streptococcus sp. DD10]|uniref:DUF6688 domain-containing protein n=1 Tax=Streptococcus sp. DD10 TaxID=1777878 RepID=UPI00079B5A24|nr:DUF6688 family protein [Streptococcus sp. DD10]KXT74810.1 hypothetical protein STRDD10_00650 [Streptococcus sp. DD10]
MKRIISLYKKWNQDLETNFGMSLMMINFLTNGLIFLACFSVFLLTDIRMLMQSKLDLEAVPSLLGSFLSIGFYALFLCFFIPNIFVLLYFIFRWDSLRKKDVKNEMKRQEIHLKTNHKRYTSVLWFGLFGSFLEALIIFLVKDMTFYDWNETLINSQKHGLIWTGSYPTFFTLDFLCLLALIVYSYRDANSLSPLLNVLCIGGILTGAILLIVFDIQLQVFGCHTLFLLVYSIQLLRIRMREWQEKREEFVYDNQLLQYLHQWLNHSWNWPWLGLLLALPTLAVIVMFLMLFGQQPDSIIKAWTNTADWTFSDKIPPQNLVVDEHYLCTVAAGGHEKLVKPQRMGGRHGHPVIVNRQLCIANAFEQVLEEKFPRCHYFVRSLYDRYGYPFAQHIKNKWLMDAIYLIMKPLEWFFLLVLYIVDRQPENRIAMQYIHPLPKEDELDSRIG